MIIAQVEPGICGFSALIRVSKADRRSIKINIESDCEHIKALADQLQTLGMRDVLKTPINKNPVYEAAGSCHLHASCAVPCGVIKASEIALGLALVKEVKINFQDDGNA
jgi:hypothetical protein